MGKAEDGVTAIEILEDVSSNSARNEEYLKLRRLVCRNRRADGSTSRPYRVDVVDRPSLDAVGVLIFRKAPGGGVEVLTRQQLRPAAYFRQGQRAAVAEARSFLFVEEIVAGVLEPDDVGEEGILRRAAEEAREEAGFPVDPRKLRLLGGPFFVAPGIISEQIYLAVADVTGLPQARPEGDGSPLEEGATLTWWPLERLLAACRSGELRDAKTEIALTRFLAEGAA